VQYLHRHLNAALERRPEPRHRRNRRPRGRFARRGGAAVQLCIGVQTRPADSADPDNGAKNRRVEIKVYPAEAAPAAK